MKIAFSEQTQNKHALGWYDPLKLEVALSKAGCCNTSVEGHRVLKAARTGGQSRQSRIVRVHWIQNNPVEVAKRWVRAFGGAGSSERETGRARTADVLGEAVGGAEDRRLQAAGGKGGEECRHGLSADRLRAAHHKLEIAQIPLPPLLRRRLPAME